MAVTPPRLCLLRCPCGEPHWEIDSDYRDPSGGGTGYPEREYECPYCGRNGCGYELIDQSPPELLITPPTELDPADRMRWAKVLADNFPGSAFTAVFLGQHD